MSWKYAVLETKVIHINSALASLLSLEQKLSQGYLDQLVWSIWISADWPRNTTCNGRNVFHHVAEIARQAAQLKLMRKLEKQAMLQAAKEARRQQGTLLRTARRRSLWQSNGTVISCVAAQQ